MGEDVAVAAVEVEDEAEAETLATQRHMDRHPRHTTTILERVGTIKGTGPKPRSNVSTIGTCAAAADGMCPFGTLAKRAPRNAASKATWKIATGETQLA